MRLLIVLTFVFGLFEMSYGQTLSITPDARNATVTRVTCNTTSSVALAANSKRRAFVFVAPANNSVTVYIGFSSSVTSSNGLPLNNNNTLSDNTYYGAVYCVTASSSSDVIVGETSR